MKSILKSIWNLIRLVSVTVLLLIGAFVLYLFVSGTVPGERWKAGLNALRNAPQEKATARGGSTDEEWRKIQEVRDQMDRTQRRREDEIRKFRDKSQLDLLRMEEERKRLEKARKEAIAAETKAKKATDALKIKKIDKVTKMNLPIFTKMKGQDLADLMYQWPRDEEIVRYLRLLPARKAADVLKKMKADPKFVKAGPGGTASRFEKINSAMQ